MDVSAGSYRSPLGRFPTQLMPRLSCLRRAPGLDALAGVALSLPCFLLIRYVSGPPFVRRSLRWRIGGSAATRGGGSPGSFHGSVSPSTTAARADATGAPASL